MSRYYDREIRAGDVFRKPHVSGRPELFVWDRVGSLIELRSYNNHTPNPIIAHVEESVLRCEWAIIRTNDVGSVVARRPAN